MKRALLSTLHLFALALSFGIALFFLFLPEALKLRLRLSDLLVRHPEVFRPIGFAALGVAFALLIGLYAANRGRFLFLRMGGHAASIDPHLLQETLERYISTHFSGSVVLAEAEVNRGKRIEISILFKSVDEGEREEIFCSLEKHLAPLLQERFGYTSPFVISARGTL
jgi:hypothetical protein